MTKDEFAQETRQEVTESPRGMRKKEPEHSGTASGGRTTSSFSNSDPLFRQQLAKAKLNAMAANARTDFPPQQGDRTPNVAENAIAIKFPNLTPEKIKELLVAEIGQTNYDLWFGAGCEFQVSDGSIAVQATSKFALTRLQSTFGRSIRQVIDRLGFPEVKISYETIDFEVVQKSLPIDAASLSLQGAEKPRPLNPSPVSESKSRRNKRQHRLSTFWFGENNMLAKASVDQLLKDLGQFSPLFFYGPCGSGKTHLLSAVTREARRRSSGGRCVYLSAEQFTSLFLQSLRGSGLPMFRRKYRDLDLLAIDDVQFFVGKKATLNEFQYTIDNLLQSGKQVMISADRPPAELGELGPDITTRLTSGLVAPLNFPGMEGRQFIARQMCQERDFQIRDEVLEFICRRVKNDVRQLSGVINRIQLAQVALKNPVGIEMAKELMEDLISEVSLGTSMRQIEKVVCDTCGVKAQDLKSSSRKKRICTARMLAMFLAREHTTSALSEIGDYFGRSHSTVIAAQKNVNSWLDKNAEIALPNAAYRVKDVIQRIQNELRVG